MNRQELITQILESFRLVHHALKQGLQPLFLREGLGMPHIHILMILAEHPNGLSVKELAELVHVTPGAISQFVDQLVKRKCVIRVSDVSDRRSVRVVLADAGEGRIAQLAQCRLAHCESLFESFTDSELKTFLSLVAKLNVSPQSLKSE